MIHIHKMQEYTSAVSSLWEISESKFCKTLALFTRSHQQQPMNYLSLFDHFEGLALKGLNSHFNYF